MGAVGVDVDGIAAVIADADDVADDGVDVRGLLRAVGGGRNNIPLSRLAVSVSPLMSSQWILLCLQTSSM
jgi:hypothetical protein